MADPADLVVLEAPEATSLGLLPAPHPVRVVLAEDEVEQVDPEAAVAVAAVVEASPEVAEEDQAAASQEAVGALLEVAEDVAVVVDGVDPADVVDEAGRRVQPSSGIARGAPQTRFAFRLSLRRETRPSMRDLSR